MEIRDWLDQHDVGVWVISFATGDRLRQYQGQIHWPFPILADPDRAAYRLFALRRLGPLQVFHPRTLALYWRLLRGGEHLQDHGKDDPFQSGGDFLVDGAGELHFVHRGHDPSDRPTTPALRDAVDRLARPAT